MTTSPPPAVPPATEPSAAQSRKPLLPQARRALEEAAARRAAQDQAARDQAAKEAAPKEIAGPKGPEPTRFGDWEVKGIASDF